MYQAPNHFRLMQRLIRGCSLFSVLGLLLLMGGLWLEVNESVSFTLTVSLLLGILLLGIYSLRRVVWLSSVIEAQLLALHAGKEDLHPILDSHPMAQGWNQLHDRLRAANSLKELEHAFNPTQLVDTDWEEAMSALPIGIAFSDSNGNLQQVNSACAAIMDREQSQLSQQNIVDVFCELCPAEASTIRARLSRPISQVVMELRRGAQTADGVIRITRTRLPGESAQGRFAWCMQDVTQQKLADEARTQFVLTATHELRTPLSNIKALAEMISLEDQIDIEDQKRFCNTIHSEANRLSRFVNELLDLNQLEAGTIVIRPSETDLERLFSEVIEHMRPEMEQKRMDFIIDWPPKLPKLRIDKDKTIAALVNLIGNAVKYTPEGGRVCLLVEPKDDEVTITVEDSGIGIAEDELSRIFEKFFRSDDDRVRELTGSGLGLAFTQEVIQRQGGRIQVTSELNKGSRFTIHLPLQRDLAPV